MLNYLVALPALVSVFKTHSDDLTKLFHIAFKKIPYYSKGELVQPTKSNGYKFELFANGFIPYLKDDVIFLQVGREEEFSPVKNPEGSGQDSPDTARTMASALHRTWLNRAGAILEGNGLCEVSEMLSYEGEGLERFKGKVVKTPVYLEK